MNQELQKTVPRTLSVGVEFDDQKVQLLKNTICKGATNDELQLFLHVCSRTGLDPFRNQIYAIKRKSKDKDGSYTEKMTIQTGIDGFRLIADRTGNYAPGREPSYNYDAQGKLVSATAYVKKRTKDGTWHEVSATAFWNEYVQKGYDGKPAKFWQQMPHGQLAKCAEALALRKSSPADFSGIYSTDEMGQADNGATDGTFQEPVIENQNEKHLVESKVETLPLPDLTQEEINAYLEKNWVQEKENFRMYLNMVKEKKEISYRECIQKFDENAEKTKVFFLKWLSDKSKD